MGFTYIATLLQNSEWCFIWNGNKLKDTVVSLVPQRLTISMSGIYIPIYAQNTGLFSQLRIGLLERLDISKILLVKNIIDKI